MSIYIDPAWAQFLPYLAPLLTLLLMSSRSERLAVIGALLTIVVTAVWIGYLVQVYDEHQAMAGRFRTAIGLSLPVLGWLCAAYVVVSIIWFRYSQCVLVERLKELDKGKE